MNELNFSMLNPTVQRETDMENGRKTTNCQELSNTNI